ncbi:Reverse transcriptase [Phytophthora palmivora]|uniref:Reverse transcriptase n=1 Tax=Phytophthora palmivora TaxID=4796 RepID=A0A2P4XV61_9STRA|nr:Reverse transcriptase [Phytophthora palmivora]
MRECGKCVVKRMKKFPHLTQSKAANQDQGHSLYSDTRYSDRYLEASAEPGERLLVVSFNGSARVKRSGGAYSGIVWNLPDCTVISAPSKYKLDLTVNEAKYRGQLPCLDLLSEMDRND